MHSWPPRVTDCLSGSPDTPRVAEREGLRLTGYATGCRTGGTAAHRIRHGLPNGEGLRLTGYATGCRNGRDCGSPDTPRVAEREGLRLTGYATGCRTGGTAAHRIRHGLPNGRDCGSPDTPRVAEREGLRLTGYATGCRTVATLSLAPIDRTRGKAQRAELRPLAREKIFLASLAGRPAKKKIFRAQRATGVQLRAWPD
jgi:hypothetical protein